MLRRLIPLIFFATVAGSILPAQSAVSSGNEPTRQATPPIGLQLAQNGDVQVFYDDQGRRVILDTLTGQVVAVEEPGARNVAPWEGERRVYRRERPRYNDRYDQELYSSEGSLPGGDDYELAPQGEPYPLTREEDRSYAGRGIERRPLDNGYTEPQPGITGSTTPDVPAEIVPSAPRMSSKASEDVAKLQVLLDRGGASPGVIDGHDGGNVRKALLAYEELTGETLPIGNSAALDAALAATGGPAFMDYTITPEDVAAPMVASIPADYGEKAKLDHLSYTSVTEMFGERFHMDENYLIALNPEANFNRAGTIIRVANVGQNVVNRQVDRIVADKARKQVRAYDAQGNLVVAYPTTIGSGDTPSPSGTHQVTRIALNPEYTYNPKINFKQGENDKILRIPPGPNGPVGTVWIALDKPTYGIHGTPDPSKIGKTESHGCVRLTNWDAAELAKLVKPGVFVQFLD